MRSGIFLKANEFSFWQVKSIHPTNKWCLYWNNTNTNSFFDDTNNTEITLITEFRCCKAVDYTLYSVFLHLHITQNLTMTGSISSNEVDSCFLHSSAVNNTTLSSVGNFDVSQRVNSYSSGSAERHTSFDPAIDFPDRMLRWWKMLCTRNITSKRSIGSVVFPYSFFSLVCRLLYSFSSTSCDNGTTELALFVTNPLQRYIKDLWESECRMYEQIAFPKAAGTHPYHQQPIKHLTVYRNCAITHCQRGWRLD